MNVKPRVTGRIRSVHAGKTYIVEMRHDGLTVRRLRGRKRYAVEFKNVLVLVKLWIDQDAILTREERRATSRDVRRAARSKNQLALAIAT